MRLLSALLLTAPAAAQAPLDISALLAAHPERFGAVLADADGLRLQVLVAEVVERDGRRVLRRSRLGDATRYFYPASAIKLCAPIAALLQVNEINAEGHAFSPRSTLRFQPLFEGEALEQQNLGRVMRSLFLVSDNHAFNCLYDFVGQDGLNERMWRAGFSSVRVHHRLSIRRTREEHRRTRETWIGAGDGAWFVVPARASERELENTGLRDLELGRAHVVDNELVEGPLNFQYKNSVSLEDLQDILAALVRPDVDTGKRGFPELSIAQRAFLLEALHQLPRESPDPVYDPSAHPDDAVKFVRPGVTRVVPGEHLRVYDKVGRAYGFSVENAYVEDQRTGLGFFLAAVLYTNPNQVLNDGVYGYAELADSFLADLGEVVARALWAQPEER
jgi:hypothetical protein